MLEFLRIHNLALIEDIKMEFTSGINVLTGETGAGKSFILKAINFVMGEKLSTDMVRPEKEKAVVEAIFVVNNEKKIFRRELLAGTGRSRLYINDQLSSQDTVRELRSNLILHTSQHGQQKLLQHSFQAKILDDFLQSPELFQKKDFLLKKLNNILTQREDLEKKISFLIEKREIFELQQQEITKISPKEGEEEELEVKREAFRNQSNVNEYASIALEFLHKGEKGPGLINLLTSFEKSIIKLTSFDNSLEDIPEMLLSLQSRLKDAESKLHSMANKDEQEIDIEVIESRLYTLAQLKRKLKKPLSAILSLQKEIEENLLFLDSCALEKKQLAIEEDEICNDLATIISLINEKRQKAAKVLSKTLQKELSQLGFSEHIRIIFDFTPYSLHPTRKDCNELRARLLWQPNPGQSPQPLDHIASGGELSRFLLAVINIISRNNDEDMTFIFDEVDAGVGGLTLNSLSQNLSNLASKRQILLITHWPQLASRAQRHFFVQKKIIDNKTYTTCAILKGNKRTSELARMAGGGEQGFALAQKLL